MKNVVRQANSDHDAIFMDNMGRKPREEFKDPRIFFKFDMYREKEKKEKDIIKNARSINDTNIIEKLEKRREELGPCQHGQYKRMKNRICKMVVRIDKLIEDPYEEFTADMLKTTRLKQGHLCNTPYTKFNTIIGYKALPDSHYKQTCNSKS